MNWPYVRGWILERPMARVLIQLGVLFGGLFFVAALGLLGGWPTTAFGFGGAVVVGASWILNRTALHNPDRIDDLRCSFCGKHRREVAKLVAGPGVYICDGCVALSSDILAREFAAEPAPGAEPPAPVDPNPFAPPSRG